MSFTISDDDLKRGKEYMKSLNVPFPAGITGDEEKDFVSDWVRLNKVTDEEIDGQIAAIKGGEKPAVASAPKIEVSPVKTIDRPTGNNAMQWKNYVIALGNSGAIPEYKGGMTVAEIKSYIDSELIKTANLTPDTFTEEEKKDLGL